MVAFDRSGEGGELRIVTYPNEIRSIEIEEQERKRNVSELINKLYSIKFLSNLQIHKPNNMAHFY